MRKVHWFSALGLLATLIIMFLIPALGLLTGYFYVEMQSGYDVAFIFAILVGSAWCAIFASCI